MTRIYDQDHKLVVVNGVEETVITDPDPQDTVHACEHLDPGGPRLASQRFSRFPDADQSGLTKKNEKASPPLVGWCDRLAKLALPPQLFSLSRTFIVDAPNCPPPLGRIAALPV